MEPEENPGRERSTLVFDSADPHTVWTFLDEAYGNSLRIEEDPGRVTFHRADHGLYSIDEIFIGSEIRFDTAAPIAMFNVMECLEGGGEVDRCGLSDRMGASGVYATSVPGHGYRGHCGPFRIRMLNLDLDVLEQTAQQEVAAPLRFHELRAVDSQDAQRWTRLVDFVSVAARPGPSHARGLAARDLAGLLATTVLRTFPNTTWDEPAPSALRRDSRDASTATVRRAVAFIDASADQDLDLAEIAAAAHASPRALQDGFRRQLGTTPMRHLQEARLRLARRELVDARGEVTVAAVASRWGFHNHGRFAAMYREQYGELPSATLTRVGAGTGVGEVDDDGTAAARPAHRRSED